MVINQERTSQYPGPSRTKYASNLKTKEAGSPSPSAIPETMISARLAPLTDQHKNNRAAGFLSTRELSKLNGGRPSSMGSMLTSMLSRSVGLLGPNGAEDDDFLYESSSSSGRTAETTSIFRDQALPLSPSFKRSLLACLSPQGGSIFRKMTGEQNIMGDFGKTLPLSNTERSNAAINLLPQLESRNRQKTAL